MFRIIFRGFKLRSVSSSYHLNFLFIFHCYIQFPCHFVLYQYSNFRIMYSIFHSNFSIYDRFLVLKRMSIQFSIPQFIRGTTLIINIKFSRFNLSCMIDLTLRYMLNKAYLFKYAHSQTNKTRSYI